MGAALPRSFLTCLLLSLATAAGVASAAPTPASCKAAADYSADLSGRALLVLHDGKVVFERYDNGWRPGLPHPLASGTKSFTGVVAAAAIEDGLIPGWDALVSDTIAAWAADELKRQITVRHLLELSSGLDPADPLLGGRGGGRLLGAGARARQERLGGDRRPPPPTDHFAAALELPMTGRPGGQFAYGPSHFYAFGAYLESRLAAAGHPQPTFREYFEARLAEPIGLHVSFWAFDRSGKPDLPGGMLLTAREWAKFGEFVRLGGAVRQDDGTLRQVVRRDVMDALFVPSATNPVYGKTWWLPREAGDAFPAAGGPGELGGDDRGPAGRLRRQMMREKRGPLLDPDGREVRVWLAAGLGNQNLIILPDHGVVIVRFAEATPRGLAYSPQTLVREVMGWR
ncbi:MAG: serine hydrolase domain-containing protein [Tepidisphaerales bacterium]